ncbi:vesicle-associated membrane protein/synaptobrevin-binding protein-like [Gigantopelta aegis]|uniref:vesicle-associated membrane protein/synaptobrevin-binding protein-like n=1 Tax=Gigantopelta aegis TaxID=1735272 RepID=UPI001B88E5F8|nr:vesicle-associated membrane protein/synaptobrevin-binding protein-like [Gigantopelta aegis]
MAKNEQVLILEPSGELRFKGPFKEVVTAELKLSNPSEKRVCFKVKTTAPKRYCVRPNSGIIEPGDKTVVSVMLQPFEYDPNEKNRHKFMVQTLFAPDGKVDALENLWKDVPPENLMDSKLKCFFDMPDLQQTHEKETHEDTRGGPVSGSSPKISSSSDPDTKKILDEYHKLQSEVSQLKQENAQLKEDGVRLRKVAMSDTISSTPSVSSSQPLQTANAIPPVVYIVAAVILGLIIGKLFL